MGKCKPGIPCYPGGDLVVYTSYPRGCTSSYPNCNSYPISSDNLIYTGSNLSNIGGNTNDTLTVIVQKINEKLSPTEILENIISLLNSDAELKAALCEALSDC